tara:strand:- start:235 stop:783 length:549 start_codon:yes stop_codon:yes gene_type:complete
MATVYEIVQGLAQAAANAYDGALDENGEPLAVGLRREEGDPILDKRVMDGFNVKFYGDMMCLSYMSEVQLREVYVNGFETRIEEQIAEIAGFLKKEYRKIRGESVTLTKEGEADIRVENSTRVRSWVTAKCHYKIGGLNEDMAVTPEADTKPEDSFRKFIDQGGWNGSGGTRPQNDTRKKES